MAIDKDYLLSCMFKTALEDRQYLTTITTVFKPEYFEESVHSEIFKAMSEHLLEFKEVPQQEIVVQSIPSDVREESRRFFGEMKTIEYDVSRNYEWLLETTNEFLKDRAIKCAIMDSVDIIDGKGNFGEIKELVETALCKDIKINLGLDYWSQLGERLQRIFTATDNRVPTYYPQLDEYLNGGFPPYTLSVWAARIHGFKCLCRNNLVKIKNKTTQEIKNIKIGELFINTYNNEYKGDIQMPSLESFQNKHGIEEGQNRYDIWRKNLYNRNQPKSQKGISKLELFQNKHGIEEGQKRYDIWLDKNKENGKKGKGRRTLPWYIDKYGDVEGQKRYDNYCQSQKDACKGINSLQWYIDKYGDVEGQKRYGEKNDRISEPGRTSLQWYIDKYGEEEGTKQYNGYITKQRYSNSEQGYIDKYGEEEGNKKWDIRLEQLKHTTSLEGFISRHGEEEGNKKWKERQDKWLSSYQKLNYSKISQELFWILYEEICNDFNDIYFAQLDENEKLDESGKNYEYKIDIGLSFCKADFFIKDTNKIIEFDGDYWHGVARGNKQRDMERDLILEQYGYQVLHVRERDYNNDCDNVLKECLEFIYE